jgi:hypothetical protein
MRTAKKSLSVVVDWWVLVWIHMMSCTIFDKRTPRIKSKLFEETQINHMKALDGKLRTAVCERYI